MTISTNSPITVHGPVEPAQAAQVCNTILRSLPEWFGIESVIVQYVEDVKMLPTWITISGDTPTGFIAIKKHFPQSAEVIVMGVMPEYHHLGVGRSLLAAAETSLQEEGVEYLQVKTLDASRCCEEYARTRTFYEAMGFRPLEVFPELWDKDNPCLLMVKRL